MGQITSLFVHKILQNVDDSVDKSKLLTKLGLSVDGSVDPERMIADDDYYAFLENVASLDPHAIDLPLRTGQSMRCDEYGAFGLAWKSASNLLGAFERAVRYARVLTNVSIYEVQRVDQGAWMILNREGHRRLGMRLSNEATIASIFAISNEACSEAAMPLEVRFKHQQPETTALHQSHFGCRVNFAADRDGILFSSKSVTVANRLADVRIVSYLDNQLEILSEPLDDLESCTHDWLRWHGRLLLHRRNQNRLCIELKSGRSRSPTSGPRPRLLRTDVRLGRAG